MRVTIDIPDGIHRRLKAKAASEGTTMRALILHEIDVYLQSKSLMRPAEKDAETRVAPSE